MGHYGADHQERQRRAAAAGVRTVEREAKLSLEPFRAQAPDEMYFGTGNAVPADLTSSGCTRQARIEARRRPVMHACQSTRPSACREPDLLPTPGTGPKVTAGRAEQPRLHK
jgi:hypothetical protein